MEDTKATEIIHHWEKADPTKKVKLIQQSKGFAWEITYESCDKRELLDEIREINNELQASYGNSQAGTED